MLFGFRLSIKEGHTARQKGWRNYKGQIDYFAVYVEKLSKIYFIPVDAVGTATAMLRLTPPKNNQQKNIRWASDYEL